MIGIMVFKPGDTINLTNGHTIKIPIIIMIAVIRYLKIKSQSHLLDLSMIGLSTEILTNEFIPYPTFPCLNYFFGLWP